MLFLLGEYPSTELLVATSTSVHKERVPRTTFEDLQEGPQCREKKGLKSLDV